MVRGKSFVLEDLNGHRIWRVCDVADRTIIVAAVATGWGSVISVQWIPSVGCERRGRNRAVHKIARLLLLIHSWDLSCLAQQGKYTIAHTRCQNTFLALPKTFQRPFKDFFRKKLL